MTDIENEVEIALARSYVYKALAALTDAPSEALVEGLRSGVVIQGLIESLEFLSQHDNAYQSAASELKTLSKALEGVDEIGSFEWLRDEHMHVFMRRAVNCPPYETEFGYTNIYQKTNSMADIAGFYRAFGVDMAPDSHERVDYLATELEFMHLLTAKEAEARKTGNAGGQETCVSAEKKFLVEHLGRWVHGLGVILKEQVGDGPYPPLVAWVAQFVGAEALGFEVTLEQINFRVRCDEKEAGKAPCTPEESGPAASLCEQAECVGSDSTSLE